MEKLSFDSAQFVRDMRAGKYDHRLHEELRKLTTEQMRQVAERMQHPDHSPTQESAASEFFDDATDAVLG